MGRALDILVFRLACCDTVVPPQALAAPVSHAYADLVKAVWTGSHTTLSPLEVKQQLPRFADYMQHDAQEYLNEFLTALHFEQNRVQHKPAEPHVACDTLADTDAAAAVWARLQRRESSAVHDLFAGQMRSVTSCDVCGTTRKAFEMFTSLSLALPVPVAAPYEVCAQLGGIVLHRVWCAAACVEGAFRCEAVWLCRGCFCCPRRCTTVALQARQPSRCGTAYSTVLQRSTCVAGTCGGVVPATCHRRRTSVWCCGDFPRC